MKIITCLCLLAITISGAAQNETHDKMQHGKRDKMMKFLPAMTRSIGGSLQKFDGLNGRVAGMAQYKQLKDYAGMLGLGWRNQYKHVISDFEISLASSMTGDRDEKSSTVHYVGVSGDIGYDLLENEKVSFFPLVGIGYQKYQAIFYKDNSEVNFNDVLNSTALETAISPVKFKNGFVVYRLGLGVALKSPKYPGNSIGLQAGYIGSFQKREWRTNDNQVLLNSPEDRISQFYISLVLTSKPWMMMKKM